jgi:hypothetical protein
MPATPGLVLGRHGWAAGSAAALLGCAQFGVGASVAPLVGLLGLRGDHAMALAVAGGVAGALAVYAVVVRPVLASAPVLPPGVAAAAGQAAAGQPAPQPRERGPVVAGRAAR